MLEIIACGVVVGSKRRIGMFRWRSASHSGDNEGDTFCSSGNVGRELERRVQLCGPVRT